MGKALAIATHLVEGSGSGQDDVRVLDLDGPLAESHQVCADPDGPTRHLSNKTMLDYKQILLYRQISLLNKYFSTRFMVMISSYASEDSPAIIPEPLRFSTPKPSSFPMMSVILYLETHKQ